MAFHIAPNINAKPPSEDWTTLEMDFHRHVEVIPSLLQSHGFERGMGFYVNFTPPEEAATYLWGQPSSWQTRAVVLQRHITPKDVQKV